ncbi:MAG TPA: protein kinase [Labilithrix sp.]
MLSGTIHPALSRFEVLQELSPESGPKTLLARSKAGTLSVIKILVQGKIPSEVATMLSREGSAAARLGHEAIVQTRALILEEDLVAIVEEFVPGVSLQRLVRFAASRGVRVPDEAGWFVVERMLAALANAHGSKDAQGNPSPIVHRGVSPSAIVIGWDGQPKLGDFALARLRALVAPLLHLPEPEVPLIVAPEQARGDLGSERSDVFCAGLVTLRLVTGRTPYARYKKSAAQLMIAMSEGSVTPLTKSRPDLPHAVHSAFERAFEPDVEKRTITAQELLDVVRGHFDVAQGKDSLGKLCARWRDHLEKSVTPWERRGSIPDDAPAVEGLKEGALMLATADERPSGDAFKASDAGDEPWKKRDEALPREETSLAPTDPVHSVSRVGAVAHEALTMPPLPPMRITAPSIPVGGPSPTLPPLPQKKGFSGGAAAAIMAFALLVLVVGGGLLLYYLANPTVPPPPTAP